MIETFTATLSVDGHGHEYERQLADMASVWFGGPVICLSRDISMTREDGVPRYEARATFVPARQHGSSRLEAAAQWLGLTSPAHRRGR